MSVDSSETLHTPNKTLEAGTPEAAVVIDKWWKRFGPVKAGLNVWDREENEQLDALETVPAELDDYYDGMFRRHLAEVQDLMVNNGIDFVEKSSYAEQEAMARSVIEINGYTDQLTGLKNRKWLEEALEAKTKEAKSNPNSNVWILFADVDRFKDINTVYDHTGGDKLLSLMGKLTRKSESLARFGGEEFVQIIDLDDVRIDDQPEATDEEKMASIINRYSTAYKDLSRETLRDMQPKSTYRAEDGPGIRSEVSLSFGATKLIPGENSLQVLSRASNAVAEAKEAGRDCAFIAIPGPNAFSYQPMRLAA